MSEVYGANYAGFIRRTLKATKHPFIPREEPISKKFVPHEKKMFEAAESVGNVVDGEIYDFGCEC